MFVSQQIKLGKDDYCFFLVIQFHSGPDLHEKVFLEFVLNLKTVLIRIYFNKN